MHPRGIAQSGSALALGASGRKFESYYPDQAPVAQLIEQLPSKQWVRSSNLFRRAILSMYKVAALYKFTKILNPFKIHNNIRSKLKNHNVNGTILVGEEGINGTISSNSKKNLDKAIEFISKLEGFKNLDIKFSS